MPGFFETIGAKMVLGPPDQRGRHRRPTRNVAVVNEAFARRFFKNQNPIGQHFGMNRIRSAGTWAIVGVVKDMRYMTFDYKDPIGPMFLVSETQSLHTTTIRPFRETAIDGRITLTTL